MLRDGRGLLWSWGAGALRTRCELYDMGYEVDTACALCGEARDTRKRTSRTPKGRSTSPRRPPGRHSPGHPWWDEVSGLCRMQAEEWIGPPSPDLSSSEASLVLTVGVRARWQTDEGTMTHIASYPHPTPGNYTTSG